MSGQLVQQGSAEGGVLMLLLTVRARRCNMNTPSRQTPFQATIPAPGPCSAAAAAASALLSAQPPGQQLAGIPDLQCMAASSQQAAGSLSSISDQGGS